MEMLTADPHRDRFKYREVVQMFPFYKGEFITEIFLVEPPRLLELVWNGPAMHGRTGQARAHAGPRWHPAPPYEVLVQSGVSPDHGTHDVQAVVPQATGSTGGHQARPRGGTSTEILMALGYRSANCSGRLPSNFPLEMTSRGSEG